MDLTLFLSVLDAHLRKEFGVDTTNKLLSNIVTDLVVRGTLTRESALAYLQPYGCSLAQTCWGCLEDQLNQLAHTDPGGCLYFNTLGSD